MKRADSHEPESERVPGFRRGLLGRGFRLLLGLHLDRDDEHIPDLDAGNVLHGLACWNHNR